MLLHPLRAASVRCYVLAALLFCVAQGSAIPAATASPGCKISLTQAGFDALGIAGLPLLEDYLVRWLKLPQITGTALGVQYNISNLHFVQASAPQLNIIGGAGGPGTLSLAMPEVEVIFSLDWMYSGILLPSLSDHGTATGFANQSSLSVMVQVGVSPEGKPVFNTTTTNIVLNNVRIEVVGKDQFAYDLLIKILQPVIVEAIHGFLDYLFRWLFDVVVSQWLLGKVNLLLPLEQGQAFADFRLLQAPSVFQNQLVAECAGVVIPASTSLPHDPVSPSPLPDFLPIAPTSAMLHVILSQELFNSALFVFQELGLFEYNLTQKNIPPDFPISLNTADWALVLPTLYLEYPDAPMSISTFLPSAPRMAAAQTTPAALNMSVVASIVINVLPDGDEALPVLGLGVGMTASALLEICPTTAAVSVCGSATVQQMGFSLLFSNIGTFDVAPLDSIVSTVMSSVVLPMINEKLAAGIPLPLIPHVALQDPLLYVGDGYLGIATAFAVQTASLTSHE